MIDADFMNLIENIAQVGFTVHAHPLHSGHDAADDPLLSRCRWIGQARARIDIQAMKMRQQFAVDKVKQLAVTSCEQFLPLPAEGSAFRGLRVRQIILERCGPILPAVGTDKRWCEGFSHSISRFAIFFLLRIQNSQKQNPGQFRHILKGAGTIGPAHDIADGFDKGGQRVGGIDRFGFFSCFLFNFVLHSYISNA